MSLQLDTIPEAVEAIRRGEVVIVVDAEDRENEGDFICAAEKATPETINFMLVGSRTVVRFDSAGCLQTLELMPVVPETTHR